MTEKELHYFLKKNYPRENERCEWKSFRSLKNAFASWEGSDIISYVSAISNMEGGHLIIGVDDSLEIIGIEDIYNYSPENTPSRILNKCPNLSSEGLWVQSVVKKAL